MKKEKVVLTKEEKKQKKLESKYQIFRNKIVSIIFSVLFVVGLILPCVISGSSAGITVTMFASVGAVMMIVSAFFIFKRASLSFMLIATGLFDIAIITNSSDASSMISLAVIAAVISLIGIVLGMKKNDKKRGNCAIKLEHELIETMIFEDDGEMSETLTYGSLIETHFKARFYFVAAIISALACGIGLLLPFGVKAYKYYKAVGFLTCEVEEKENKTGDSNKPYKNLVTKEEAYIRDKTFSCKSSFFSAANWSVLLGFGYVIISSICAAIVRKPDFSTEDAQTAGTVIFTTKTIEGFDPEIVQALEAYSKNQSDENRQYFIDALQNLKESYEEWSEREGRRLQAYEEEKWRSARKYATGTSVETDGKDYYVSGSYSDGSKGKKKLEGYDTTTGVGYYTDESGKKVEIKNTNLKK